MYGQPRSLRRSLVLPRPRSQRRIGRRNGSSAPGESSVRSPRSVARVAGSEPCSQRSRVRSPRMTEPQTVESPVVDTDNHVRSNKEPLSSTEYNKTYNVEGANTHKSLYKELFSVDSSRGDFGRLFTSEKDDIWTLSFNSTDSLLTMCHKVVGYTNELRSAVRLAASLSDANAAHETPYGVRNNNQTEHKTFNVSPRETPVTSGDVRALPRNLRMFPSHMYQLCYSTPIPSEESSSSAKEPEIGYRTRSKGPVASQENVMTKPLEYDKGGKG